MFFTVSVLICVFSLVQTSFISEKTLVGSISSWQTQTELDHLEDISTRYILLVEVVNSSTHRLSTATCSHFHVAHVKSGQIRDARPKTGQIGVPGDL